MIEVWVRLEDEYRGRKLMEWPSTDLDEVMPTVERWGMIDKTSGAELGGGHSLVGQFKVDGNRAYFEIIMVDSE